MSDVLLKIEGLSKSFGITHANKDIHLELKAGEVRGLAGENGSGKSTLLSQIAGLYGSDEGKMYLEGQEYKPSSPIDAQSKGIAMIVQELGMIGNLPSGINIFMGNTKRFRKGPFLNLKKFYDEAEAVRKKWDLPPLNFKRMAGTMNVEQRKMMELVRALACDPKILILDEVTQSLSQDNRQVIYKVIERCKAEGRSILMISHDLEETMRISDTISVLRDGEMIGTVNASEINDDELKRMMVGREVSGAYYRDDQEETHGEKVLFSMKDVSSHTGIRNLNFEVRDGEIIAFCGLSDSGIHDIGQLAYGLMPPATGKVVLSAEGGALEVTNPRVALNNKMAYVPKDRDGEAMLIKSTIEQNTVLPSVEQIKGKCGILKNADMKALAEKAKADFRVKCTGIRQKVNALSGGNKQKINLGRWMIKDLKVMIVDCPTRGVDVGVKAYIYECLRETKKQGIATVMITDELSEAMGMADRIIVMKNGEIVKEISRSEGFNEESIIEVMI